MSTAAARNETVARRPRVTIVAAGALSLLAVAPCAAAPPPLVPTPIGAGPAFHPAATNRAVVRGLPLRGLRCVRREGRRSGVHLELFARGRVVIVPAGIGIAPPLRTDGPYVRAGRCSYAVRTRAPTGVIEVAGARRTLRDFFAVWGRAVSARSLLGFRAAAGERVRAYVDGRRWLADPLAIPLARHAEIVLEVGPFVPPHAEFRFAGGL